MIDLSFDKGETMEKTIKVTNISWDNTDEEYTAPNDLPSEYELKINDAALSDENEYLDDFIANKLNDEFNWSANNFSYEIV